MKKNLSLPHFPGNAKYWLLFSLSVFLVTSWFSTGYNQSDEHFQLFEFAGLKLDINSGQDLAWEYREQMRPTLQVGMIVVGHKILNIFGLDDPFIIAWLFRVLSALFSFGIALFFYKLWVDKFKGKSLKWLFFLCSFFLWFLFYNGVRFNSEMWSGHSFALAVGLFWYWCNKEGITNYSSRRGEEAQRNNNNKPRISLRPNQSQKSDNLKHFLSKKSPNRWQYLVLGILVGLSFLFRYQTAFMIAGWGLWLIFIHKETWDKLAFFTLGGLLMVGLGILTDRWFYGEWVYSLWNYFEQNILLDKASHFGVDPWWHYFSALIIKAIPPFSLIYLFALFLYIWKFPKSLITWVGIAFIGIHLLIAHKELRFLYPLLPFLPIILMQILEWVHQAVKPFFWQNKLTKLFTRFFWIQNGILVLFIAFWPIITEMNIYKTIYYQYEEDITLYGIDDNPYRMALDIHYYRRQNLCVMEVDTISNLPFYGKDKYLVAIDKKKVDQWEQVPGKKTLIYSTFPEWIYYFNVGNWLSRTQWWLVWEVEGQG